MAERIAVNNADRKAALEDAWDAAPDTDRTLRAQLRTFEKAAREGVADNVLSSASNGHSGTNFFPGQDAPTSTETARLWRELLDLFDDAQRFLINAEASLGNFYYFTREGASVTDALPIAAPTDVQVDAKMRQWLGAPTSIAEKDYTHLRG